VRFCAKQSNEMRHFVIVRNLNVLFSNLETDHARVVEDKNSVLNKVFKL